MHTIAFKCFQTLEGHLRPTTDFETVIKYPKLDFQIVKGRIRNMTKDKYARNANFPPYILKHTVGVSGSLRFSGWPQASFQSMKAF